MSLRYYKFILFLIVAVSIFRFVEIAKAAEKFYCFCADDLQKITEENYNTAEDKFKSSGCIENNDCTPDKVEGGIYDKCTPFINEKTACDDAAVNWQKDKADTIASNKNHEKAVKGVVGKFIPECLNEAELTAECRDVGVFIILGINVASYLFGIIGALALLMFVYGGFTIIISQGNPEKVKQGTGIIMAAVIGLLIVFGGYLLIQFLGKDVLKIGSTFTL